MLSVPLELAILLVLVLGNGLLAMTETAVVSARKARLRELAAKNNLGASRALELAEHPTRFLALVQFWMTLSGMIAGVLGGAQAGGQVALALARVPALQPVAVPLGFVVVTLGLTGFMLLFGELVPKRIGRAHPEKVASILGGSMRSLAWLAAPFLRVLELATDGVTRLIRLRTRPVAEAVGEDEVRALIEQGLHAGVFQRAEKEMVEGVLALDQLPVTAIMTPRPKIIFLNLDDSEEVNWRKIVTSGHSYFPVYQTNRDQIVGMVAVKALWAHSAIGLPTTLKNLLVPPLMVPATQMSIQLLEQFKKTGKHIAVVSDEFGAVQGLVTLIDVLEAIVGDLPSQGHRNQPEVKRREDGSLLVDATLATGELKHLLELQTDLPQEHDAEYQTVGGFVMTQFGRIPAAGDYFTWNGWKFEVMDMDRRRVDKVLIARAPTPPVAAED
ncbi:MAG TPA: hemolysin family protein [Opitutaceae bacterium]|nr:hemolysin family protein [Opitutaceae bacterium]HND62437.1 hemolysin family protein [Opitutaceae bacterium]